VAGTSGCGCGCGGAGDCQGGSYVRPLFFAGQLLTEEDLQALGDYGVAKSRLHNRHFFGQGVVCGFEVTCQPCGGGKVTVHPGHALDCCGNDIVLPCAQTLDVNAMARDLRQRLLGGYDCGDPCAGTKAAGTPKAATNPDGTPAAASPVLSSDRRQYCLYVRYSEDLTDPVSPYATDEPCGSGGCQPTRVREELRFELRCREDAKPPVTMIDRFLACLGDVAQLERMSSDLRTLDNIVRQTAAAVALDRDDSAAFDAAALAQSVDAVETAAAVTASQPSSDNVQQAVSNVAVLSTYLQRFNALGEAEKTAARQANPALDATLRRVAPVLDQAQTNVLPHVEEASATPLDSSFALGVMEQASQYVPMPKEGAAPVRAPGEQPVPGIGWRIDERLCFLRENLLDRLDGSPDLARCELRRKVKEIQVPCPPGKEPLSPEVRNRLSLELRDAWLAYWQDCLCRALLPPCPACDDSGVLLACLDVEECEVVKICNLERTFVPTAVALRYWLPLHALGDAVEAFCCQELRCPEGDPVQTVNLRQTLLAEARLTDADLPRLRRAVSSLYELACGDRVPVLRSAVAAVRTLMARPVAVAAPPAPAPAAAASPAVAAVTEAPVPAMETIDPGAVRQLADAQQESATALAGTQQELSSLRAELASLAKQNASLEKRLKTLEGRKKP
jgi:hypothetical protein